MEKENSTISLKDKLRLGGIVILCAICSNLEYDLAKTLQMDKNPTTQNQVPFQSEIEKYGFDVDQDSKTLTMALQFNHNEGDMVINSYDISLRKEDNIFHATIDDGGVLTKNKEYSNASLDNLLTDVQTTILGENQGLNESTLSKVYVKFGAAKNILRDMTTTRDISKVTMSPQ